MNEKDTIEVRINKQFYDGVSSKFIIKNSLGEIEVLKLKCKLETKTECIYFFIHENIKIGEEYTILDDHNYGAILEYALIVKSEEFDNQFYYSQDDLGPTYTKEVTYANME